MMEQVIQINQLQTSTLDLLTNAAWLKDVPSNWIINTLGSLLVLKSDKNHPEYEVLSVYRDYGVIIKNSRDDNHNATSEDTSTYKAVNPGDLIINKMKAWQGSMGISSFKGIVSPAYITCNVDTSRIHSAFLHQLLRCHTYIGEYNRLSYGVRIGQWDMHYEDFKRIPIAIPPYEDQIKIANLLSDKLRQIDVTILQKQMQIDLLNEQKQVLIFNTVIRGLDNNVLMKDSGFSWIGKIPKTWKIDKLRNCLRPISIKNRPDLPLLSITRELGIIERDLDDKEENHNFIPEDLSGYKVIKKGQFGMNKMKAWQGSYGISPFTGIVSPAYYVFDLISDILPDFIHIALRSKAYIPFFTQASDGVRIGQWDLAKDRMKEIPIIIPPKEEQIKIISFLKYKSQKFSEAIALKEKEIDKLKEYKITLIDSMVTGKVSIS